MMHGQRLINAFTPSNLAAGISPSHFTVYRQFALFHNKDVNSKKSAHIHGIAVGSYMHHLMTEKEIGA
jgi:hypothetical protein